MYLRYSIKEKIYIV